MDNYIARDAALDNLIAQPLGGGQLVARGIGGIELDVAAHGGDGVLTKRFVINGGIWHSVTCRGKDLAAFIPQNIKTWVLTTFARLW